MRLIDADEAFTVYRAAATNALDLRMAYKLKAMLDQVPTVDAVEAVRCKDCIMWHTIVEREIASRGLCLCGGSSSQLTMTSRDGFCANGDRGE